MGAPVPETPHRYFFIHLQKTAGTTLRHRLMNHFGEAAVYPNRSDATDITTLMTSVEYLQQRLEARGDEIRVVSGHFPLCTAAVLGGRFETLTILRDPVERTLSYLRHHRENTPEDRDKPLEEIYDDPFRFHGLAHNHMTKMFSLTPSEMTAGMLTHVKFTRDHLERAKRGLTGVGAVGLYERFEEFCSGLSQRFGWRLGERQVVNTSQPVAVPRSFRARIAEDNAFDLELYEFARELYGRTRGTGR
jgi:Sulfotransferase family